MTTTDRKLKMRRLCSLATILVLVLVLLPSPVAMASQCRDRCADQYYHDSLGCETSFWQCEPDCWGSGSHWDYYNCMYFCELDYTYCIDSAYYSYVACSSGCS